MDNKGEKHFVLIHGGFHGAWCWYKVATHLKAAGHKVTALDLAACGIHPKQAHEVSSFSDYMEPLTEFMASLPQKERVILVGHSFGGFSISAAMDRFPHKVCIAVFCTAFMPSPDFGSTTIYEESTRRLDRDSDMDIVYAYNNNNDGPAKEPTSFIFSHNFMASKLYQLSPAEDLTLAMSLTRPHPIFKDLEIMPNDEAVVAVPDDEEEKYGAVQRVYIVCDQDKVIKEDFQRLMIAKSKTDEVKLIPGSDHMLMFSKPQELFYCLQEIAQKFT